MKAFLLRLREPMTLAGLFTIGAVALALRFVPAATLPVAAATLAAYAAVFLLLSIGPDHWLPARRLGLIAMAALALLMAWMTPRLGVAQVLLVIWTACAFSLLPPRWALLWLLPLNGALYTLMLHTGFDSPLTMVLINVGFQALAGLCVHYARRAEESRDQLALVNADLLATRALLADSARSNERLRVARELHDVAGHKLTAMQLNLRALAGDPALAAHPQIPMLERLSRELLADIRDVVREMREDRGLDLRTALHALAAPLPSLAMHLHIDEDVVIDDPATAEALLRLVQEALTNAARHAQADRIDIRLSRRRGELHVSIEDNGRVRGRVCEGNGIAGMRERIGALQGRLELGRSASGALRIDVALPA